MIARGWTDPRAIVCIALVLGLALAACGGGSSSAVTPTSLDTDFVVGAERASTRDIGVPEAGTARVVLGRAIDGVFDLSRCSLEGAVGSLESVVVDGVAVIGETDYRLEVRRFRSEAFETTITDTITVYAGPLDTPVGALQAQRFEVNGIVTDARDPDATTLIMRIGATGVTGEALFAVPGAVAADRNLVEGVFAATC